VEQIEAGALDAPTTTELLQTYLRPLLAAGADTIVLGCTHYPLLTAQIRRIVGPGIALIDAAPAVARQAARLLSQRGIERAHPPHGGAITYATTSDRHQFERLLWQLGLPQGTIESAYVSP